MKKFYPLIIFTLFGLISACTTLHTNYYLKAKTPGQLRVVTFNVNWGNGDWINTAPLQTIRAIGKTKADIVLLQETTPKWQRLINSYLSARYPYRKFLHYPNASGLAVLSKQPFYTTYYGHPGLGWHPGWILCANTVLGQIQFANLHLQPPLVTETSMGFLLRGYFSAPMIRLKEIKYYYQLLRHSMPTIIVGDFNEGDRGYAIKYLQKQGYIDVLSYQQISSYTWQWQVGPLTLRDRLDHILSNKYLRPTNVQILHEGNSDHYPLVVDFIRLKHD